jgi:iron complex transport system permease protein
MCFMLVRHTAATAFFFATAVGALLVALVAGVAVGSVAISPFAVVHTLATHLLPGVAFDASVSEIDALVIWSIRTPRVLVAALVGMALAVAGAQMQGLFQNPLASPDIVGTSAGAALGSVCVIALGLAARSIFYIPVFAFLGAALALAAVYALSATRGRGSMATLLLSGVAINSLFGAGLSLVVSLSWVRWEVAQEIAFWMMGGLENRTWIHVIIIALCFTVGVAIALLQTRELDVLLLGEETAASLGVDAEHVKVKALIGASILTGGAVAVSGVVGFVGLIAPHIVRLVIGPKHRLLLPASALVGGAFLICADLLARTVHRPEEIRLGIISALFGTPFFMYLLIRHQRDLGGTP